MLEAQGWVVQEAQTGAEALEVSRQMAISAAIVDRVMPDIDGETVIERLRQFRPHIKLALVSASLPGAGPKGATLLSKPLARSDLHDFLS